MNYPRSSWRTVMTLLVVIAVCPIGGARQTAGPKAFRRGDVTWVWMRPGQPLGLGGVLYYEKFNPQTYVRKDYIKRPTDDKPLPFFTHSRGIEVCLGHLRRSVLIEDDFASKGTRVMVVNLKTGAQREIEGPALKRFDEDTSPDPRLLVAPVPYAFSPDDTQALIRVELMYAPVATAEQAAHAGHSFKPRWYAVRSRDGRVLRVFRGEVMPERWWEPHE